MSFKEVKQYLAPLLEQVEARIDASLESDIHLLNSTNRALRENGGKMLRPMLCLLSGAACGKVNDDTLRYAAASELLHNATLLHDDVVDGAVERRGMPTVASLLNNPAAVLIGDYWLVRCIKIVLEADVCRLPVLSVFAKTMADLTEGELLQMEKASLGDMTESDYIRIIYGKTASLFESAAVSAAYAADASDSVREAIGCFARTVGIAFQIKDDIFDYQADTASVGKPVGIDLLEQKITQPLLCALETVSTDEATAVRRKVVGILDHPELAAEVTAFVHEHDGVALACQKQDAYIAQALSCLEKLPDRPEREYLAELARYVGERTR